MPRSSRHHRGPRLTWRAILKGTLRLPVDLVTLTWDFARVNLWLVGRAVPRRRGHRSRVYRPCLSGEVEVTASGRVQGCRLIRKYGNPFVLRMLFPGIRRVQTRDGQWFHSWGTVNPRSPVGPGAWLLTAVVLGAFWGILAAGVWRWQAPGQFHAAITRLGLSRPAEAAARPADAPDPARAERLAADAAAHAAAGRQDEAMAAYRAAVAADPGCLAAQLGLGSAALASGDRDGARLAFTAALERDPVSVEALRVLGEVSLADGAPAAAATVLDRLLRQAPDDAMGLILRARAHAAQGQAQDAWERLQRVSELRPDLPDGWLARGHLLQSRGQYDGAGEAYARALQCDPASVEARLGQLRVQIARGDLAAALPAAAALCLDYPDREDVVLGLVTALERGGHLNEAIEIAHRAAREHPDFREVRLALGGLYLAAGQRNEAYKAARSLLADQPGTGAAHLQIAALLNAAGLPALAVEHCRTALAQRPHDGAALRLLAQALLADGDAAAAAEALHTARVQDPNDVGLQIQWARCVLHAGRPDEAEAVLRPLLERHPDAPAVQEALTEVAFRRGNLELALQHARENLRLAPGSAMAMNNLAALQAYLGRDLDEALTLARQAFAMTPDDPIVADTVGWVLVQRGEAAAALEPLRYAVRRAPLSGEAAYHLAVALHRAGHAAEARPLLERALRLGGDFVGAAEARALLESLPKPIVAAPAPPAP